MIKWITDWISGIAEKSLLQIRESGENRINFAQLSKIEFNNNISEFKACETCGCLIHPDHAVKGKPEIKQKREYTYDSNNCYTGTKEVDYIYTPYYCKVHAPGG